MAAVEIITISSSPQSYQPRASTLCPPSRFYSILPTSDPLSTRIVIASKAAPIPGDAVVDFRSAITFAKKSSLNDENKSLPDTLETTTTIGNNGSSAGDDHSAIEPSKSTTGKGAKASKSEAVKKSVARKTKKQSPGRENPAESERFGPFLVTAGDDTAGIVEPESKRNKPQKKETAAKKPRITVPIGDADAAMDKGESKLKKSQRKVTMGDDTTEIDKPEPKPKKPRKKTPAGDEHAAINKSEPKPKKARKKKNASDKQTYITQGTVTKPGTSAAFPVKSFITPPGLNSTNDHAGHEVGTAGIHHEKAGLPERQVEEPRSVVFASRRRDCWTPPKNSSENPDHTFKNAEEESQTNDHESSNIALVSGATIAFSDLREQFAYNDQSARIPVASVTRTAGGETPTKRQRLEPIDSGVTGKKNHTSPLKKTKAPAKSTRTITRIAIENLKSPDKQDLQKGPATHSFFAARAILEDTPADTLNMTKQSIPTKGKKSRAFRISEEGKVTKTKSNKTKKKIIVNIPKLLSPQTALRKIARQGLLFGTASQIEREESPSFIRDLQQAMRESEILLDNNELSTFVIRRHRGSRLHMAERRLWSAGTRDDNETLLAVETIDEREQNLLPLDEDEPKVQSNEKEFLDVDEIQEEPTRSYTAGHFVREASENHQDETGFVDIDSVQEEKDKQKPEEELDIFSSQNLLVPTTPVASNDVRSQVTVLKLSSASYRPRKLVQHLDTPVLIEPKPVEARALQPLDVNSTYNGARALDQLPPDTSALKSKRAPKSVDATLKAKAKNAATDSEAPKKPRGRPRKDPNLFSPPPKRKKVSKAREKFAPPAVTKSPQKSTKWTSIDDIEDSEAEPTSSPPRRRSPFFAPALELSQPIPPPDEPPPTDPAAAQALLFTQITLAVKSAPRTTDPKRPSWQEKMLLYDPIVLEDLTAWLNSGALKEFGGRVVEVEGKGVVKAAVVQKWCEQMSVCCLWREGLRGGVKAGY